MPQLPSRPPLLSGLAVALAAAALAARVADARSSTLDYPACPETHAPEMFCCEYSPTVKHVYTKFNLPTGGPFEDEFREGWNKVRQVNFPYRKYTPDTPTFYYDKPETICRTQTIVVDKTTGTVDETLQCADQNASLVDESKDATVFWTFAKNIRNNNASFPIGATCTSLMDKTTGAVDEARRALCVSTAATVTPQFTTYTEGALVAIYVIYAAFFALLCAWYLFKKAHKVKLESATDKAEKRLLTDRGGPATPQSMEVDQKHLQIRISDARLQLDSDSVLQTGYSQSVFGTFVFVYYALATIGMSVLLLFIIMDYYAVFSPPLFSSSGPNVVAFFITWLCTAIWYVITVSLVKHGANFFRVESGLSVCDYVHIVKRDDTEVLLHDKSGVSDFVARLEKFFMPDDYIKGFRQTLPVQKIDGTRVIVFQHVQYLYEPSVDRFVPGAIPLGRAYADLLDEAGGLTETEARERYQIVGSNDVNVEMPSMLKSLVQEFLTLFYVYQIMCYFVWYYFDYYTLAIVMTSVILISAAINIYTKRRMQASVVQMTSYTTDVTVCRDKTWRTVKSPELVPGDLVRVSENWELPCDMVIVRGSTVCDESMLTGESMPVQKFPIPDNSKAEYDPEGASKKHTLFAGTRVLSSGRNEDILAIVQTTGAHTSKGQLVQSILFPLPMRFKYDEHLKVLIGGLLMYGVIAASLAVHFLTSNGNLSNKMTAFCYCVFMISGIVSPLMPVVITVGQVNASQRLEKRGVFSLNTQRITLCGKVRVFCFDKTGTLTKQGLDFLGVQRVNSDDTFGALVKDVQNTNALAAVAQYAIATCHSVGSLDGRYVGNEVEVKMLTASGWTLVEREGEKPFVTSPTDPDVALEFVKRYDFDHHRMSMSVVVRDRASGKHFVFCKGSYERMQELSLDATLPADYKAVADHLAKDGCYVLGVSYRELPSDWSPEDIDRFVSDREAVDTELSLLGLVLFRNEIKDDTPSAIAALKAGDTRVVMITGDNAMCGCYIARESGMIDAQSRVILGDMVENTLEWRDVDHGTTYSLTDIQAMVTNIEDIELAVTGTAFDTLVATGDVESLLLHIRIFSRMTPSGKVECVKLHMETGAVTGMCGDGGNDCGALRIAHVGVALSDTDASVVSPFTSRSKTVTSVVDLCREGRCSVATSFASVKMLVMYGVIASTLRLFQYYNGVIMSEWCYILADGFTMVGLSYVITVSRPLPTLGPQRPTSSLIGPTTLVSLIGQELINVIFLFTGIHLLTSQDWYCPFTPDNVDLAKWWLLSDNAMATCLFYSVIAQQQVAAWVFSFGTHYRLPIYRNYALVIAIVVLIALDLYLILGEPSVVTDLFRIASGTNVIGLPYIPLPHSFRVKYLFVIIGDVVAVTLFEYIVVLGPVRDYFRRKHHVDTLPMRK